MNSLFHAHLLEQAIFFGNGDDERKNVGNIILPNISTFPLSVLLCSHLFLCLNL